MERRESVTLFGGPESAASDTQGRVSRSAFPRRSPPSRAGEGPSGVGRPLSGRPNAAGVEAASGMSRQDPQQEGFSTGGGGLAAMGTPPGDPDAGAVVQPFCEEAISRVTRPSWLKHRIRSGPIPSRNSRQPYAARIERAFFFKLNRFNVWTLAFARGRTVQYPSPFPSRVCFPSIQWDIHAPDCQTGDLFRTRPVQIVQMPTTDRWKTRKPGAFRASLPRTQALFRRAGGSGRPVSSPC